MLKLMSYKNESQEKAPLLACQPEDQGFHRQLVDGYLQSHKIRNHSENTIDETRRVLTAWFTLHGTESRTLFTWEAMKPVHGRRRIANYCSALVESEVAPNTIRRYLGILKGYFSYVLEHPFVFSGESAKRICDLYHSIEQPVSEFDMPVHVYNGETLGVPLDPAKLYDFYEAIRKYYLALSGYSHVKARNYAMVVLAGESGLRSDELCHLETDLDLFFDSHKLQTRHAKSTRGSGKRSRVTLFTPLARDTIRFYLKNHRPFLSGASSSPYLFPSRGSKALSGGAVISAIKIIKATVNKNNFPVADHLGWHWMRRLFATRFIERFPHQLHVLVELLGHLTPNTVHAYIRHSDAWMDKKIIEMLEGSERTE
jgi:site-specific recombinase XerD